MWTKHDQLSKGVLSRALAPAGFVGAQQEIVGEVQAADIWFYPAADCEAERARLGLLGRMVEMPCLIEPFHATPSARQVLACMSKQLNLHGMLVRESARRRESAPASARDGMPASAMTRPIENTRASAMTNPPPQHQPWSPPRPWPRALVPRLWVLSAGRPERTMDALGLVPMTGWPRGFWQLPAPLLRMHLVVVRDLPETRDTLLLRLLGRGTTLRRAIHELSALPAHAWEQELAIPQLLLAYRIESSQSSGEDEMNHTSYVDELQAIYDEWEAQVKREGEQAGRLKAVQENLRGFYEARFGAPPPEVQNALEATDDIEVLQQWIAPFATRTAEEIAALVRAGRAGAHAAS